MGFRDKATEDVKQARESSNNERQQVEQIEVDMSTTTFVHSAPTTIVTGEFPEDEGNPIIRFPDAQHNEGRLDQGYLGLVYDSPEVVVDEEEGTEGTVILDVEDSNEVRVFDENDKGTDVIDGVGVEYDSGQGSRLYRGDFVDSFEADRIILIVSGAASKNVAKKLDVNGAVAARMAEDGSGTNGGLIEYPAEDFDAEVSSRYARNPELRDELFGNRVGLMVARREELDEDYAEMVDSGDRRAMKWFSIFADTGDGFEGLEPVEGEPTGYTYLDLGNYDPNSSGTYLPDEDFKFVMNYVEAVESGETTADEENIHGNISDHADELSDDPNVDVIVEKIQERV